MADYKAKKVIFKNRDNEYLIPYIDNVYTKEEIDELLKDVPSDGGAGLQLFDLIEKDHILTYEESKGLALLGSYVYKEAVAGSRYGYPDFYNKAVAEKEAGVATETTLGENTVTMYVNPNGHIFYDIADKGAVDAFYETYGVAWYYGVDTENERIFLPRNDWFTQNGTTDEIGKFIDAGLPDHDHTTSFYSNYGWDGTTRLGSSDKSNDQKLWTFTSSKASVSNPIYGNSDTVQPKAVKKLFYMCVGNTEVSEAVTNVTEVTTTENDTIPLLTGMYFDFKPNNVSWLKGGEQANSGGVYTFCYNELVNELTTPKYGLKVIETKDMVSGEDYSEYWKVNQDDMTFTTPLLDGSEDIIDYTQGQDITSGYVAPYRCIGYAHAKRVSNNVAKVFVDGVEAYRGEMSGEMVSDCGTQFDIPQGATVTTSGTLDILKVYPCKGNGSLYFKVANAVQNLELLDAGYILENMVDKTNLSEVSVCIEEYVNGKSGYRIYSDVGNGKRCVQWGITTTTDSPTKIYLLHAYRNTKYQVFTTLRGVTATGTYGVRIDTPDPTYFQAQTSSGTLNATGISFSWLAIGYLA